MHSALKLPPDAELAEQSPKTPKSREKKRWLGMIASAVRSGIGKLLGTSSTPNERAMSAWHKAQAREVKKAEEAQRKMVQVSQYVRAVPRLTPEEARMQAILRMNTAFAPADAYTVSLKKEDTRPLPIRNMDKKFNGPLREKEARYEQTLGRAMMGVPDTSQPATQKALLDTVLPYLSTQGLPSPSPSQRPVPKNETVVMGGSERQSIIDNAAAFAPSAQDAAWGAINIDDAFADAKWQSGTW